jgi:hypothetical protein
LSNICPCPNPPGGTIRCNDDQLAVCGYRDGQIVSGCFDRPDHVKSAEEENLKNLFLCNWILSFITGATRSRYAAIEDEDLALLRAGRYRTADTAETLKFSVPRDLDMGNIAKVAVAGA